MSSTWGPGNSEADVATRRDSNLAAGLGDHLPVGYWSGAIYRSAIRFPKPAWAAWTSIVSATLTVYNSDFQHVGVRNSSIYVRQQSAAGPFWTKAAGTQDCENGFSAGNNTQSDDVASVTGNQVAFSSGTAANAKRTINVTAIVRSYFALDQKPVFVFDPVGTGDYTELWAREHTGSMDPTLTIVYEDAAVPLAPTVVSPRDGAVVVSQTPTLTWVHNDPDPQVSAHVKVYGADGTTLVHEYTPAGATQSLVLPDALNRGQSYIWQVATVDVTGEGAWSGPGAFTIAALPVVTVDATRRMTFDVSAHQPRLIVQWTSDQPQASYRVTTASGYDSGLIAGADTSHTIARNLVNGTAENVTVTVTSTSGLTGSASRGFTPRWGLTTHRKDLAVAPTAWGLPTIVSTVPSGASLVMEYGSDPAANAVPASGWLSSPSAMPKSRYLFWRAWFIPSATASPVLDRVDIPVSTQVQLVDKWGTTRDVAALVAPWSVDTAEAVYGTRSLRADVTGAGPFRVYAFKVKLRANRTYILTGLMKSLGNSGAKFQLEDGAGNVLLGGGMLTPVGTPVVSPVLNATTDWYDLSKRDTNRYHTPTYPAGADMDAYVVLVAGGAAGSIAWFDAIKLEESSVATPWSPGAIGAVVADSGGLQVDGSKGGIWRYRGTAGGARDYVEGGASGLKFGGDTELSSPIPGHVGYFGGPNIAAELVAGGVELTQPTPYVDFKDTLAEDFDVRLWMPTPGVLEAVAPGGLKVNGAPVSKGWVFVPITTQLLRNNVGNPGGAGATITEEATSIPANVATAVQLQLGVRDTGGANISINAINWDNSGAGQIYSSGIAGRGGWATVGPVMVGGANGRQFKWSGSAAGAPPTYWVFVLGYWMVG